MSSRWLERQGLSLPANSHSGGFPLCGRWEIQALVPERRPETIVYIFPEQFLNKMFVFISKPINL